MKLRQLKDLDDLERMALISMSYSRMDTYDSCAAKYYYTYIQKEDRVFGPAATLGNVLHNVLEDVVGEELQEEEMLKLMSEHREVLDPEHQIDEVLMGAGRNMLIEFIDRHEGEEFDIIGKELPFQLVIGSGLVIGYIDLVVRDEDGTIRIIDYKSGKFEVAAKNIHENLQVGLYALAASLMFPDTPIYAELYYLRTGKRKGHLFSPEDLEQVYEQVLVKINNIINDRNFFVTDNARTCVFMCDFSKSGACKIGAKRLHGY